MGHYLLIGNPSDEVDDVAYHGLRQALRPLRAPTAGRAGRAPGAALRTRLAGILILARQGVLRPVRPDKLLRIANAWRRWGVTLPLGYAVGAILHPDRPAVIDELGALSFSEINTRTTRLAHGLREHGAHPGARVGVLCRNHHGLVETVVAAAKIGVDVVLLNTGLSTPQLDAVMAEQRVSLLVLDSEFDERAADLPERVQQVVARTGGSTRRLTVEHLIGEAPATRLPRPSRHARVIVLTSGTTGTPKGARRPDPSGLTPAANVLSRLPLRRGERMLVCAPIFHTWGFAAFQLGVVLGATLVLHRRFDPWQTLAAVQRHRCTSLFAVPVMLQRILELPADRRKAHDTGSLRTVACSGSALPGDLAIRFQREYGPVLHNFYGSTEVSWVSIADPRDLLAAPGTAGRPPLGTELRILDDQGRPVPAGTTGRIFVGNEMLFEGYTNGSSKEVRQGLMATGDLGFLDNAGRLHVAGREDDMIVSGGENVHPAAVEELIAGLPEVAEVAVTGVDDEEFGQRLAAFVVPRPGSRLDAETVREAVRARLARYSVPRDVVFLDELPRNATGKVVPRELPSSG